eukprot:5450076-Amphidinium_carterae.2
MEEARVTPMKLSYQLIAKSLSRSKPHLAGPLLRGMLEQRLAPDCNLLATAIRAVPDGSPLSVHFTLAKASVVVPKFQNATSSELS